MTPRSRQAAADLRKRLPVLVVSPFEEDYQILRKIADGRGWDLREARHISAAMKILVREAIPVVICERELPVGDWKMLLEAVQLLPAPPQLIVSCRQADNRLWAEVLNLGGYDLLCTPFNSSEVERVVQHATSSCFHKWGKPEPHELVLATAC